MTASLFTSTVFGALVSDPEVSALFEDEAFVAGMVRFEAALAQGEAEAGAIPREAGLALAEAIGGARVDPAALRAGTAVAAIPAPALVAELRAQVPAALGQWLHWGATSQDVVDTAFVLALRDAAALIDARLSTTAGALARLAEAHRRTPMLGRTWAQHATPMSFGLVAAYWLAAVVELRRSALGPEAFPLQLGGAVGDFSAIGPAGLETRARMAEILGLGARTPWHADRLPILKIGGWLTQVSVAFGKIGMDLIALSQSDVGEVRLGSAGGSSTMPQKQNPVGPSTLVALARSAVAAQGTLGQAALHGLQRDGQAWILDWAALPGLALAAGGAARIAEETLAALEPDAARMRANLDAAGAAPLAEAISFALSAHLPRAEAQALVKSAAREAAGGDLIAHLKGRTDAPIDWDRVSDPAQDLGLADALIDEILAAAAEAGLV
ncbi:MAG: lyase family protein [Pseudomonadota bacterium]